jgi:hypothetical protein
MKPLTVSQTETIVKALGFRLEFLLESPSLFTLHEVDEINCLLVELGYQTWADPESGEIQIERRQEFLA